MLCNKNNDLFNETLKVHYQNIKNATSTISTNNLGRTSKTPRESRTPTMKIEEKPLTKPFLKRKDNSRNSILPKSITERATKKQDKTKEVAQSQPVPS